MLTLMLLQCLFVAVEAACDIFIPEESHHSLSADAFAFDSTSVDQPHSGFDDHVSGNDAAQESCDHCCQCHGHSSHVAVLPFVIAVTVVPETAILVSYPTDASSKSLSSIYRPPIV